MRRGVAQLAARCVWDAEVGGSSPPTPTFFIYGTILLRPKNLTSYLTILSFFMSCQPMPAETTPAPPETENKPIGSTNPPTATPEYWVPSLNSQFQIQLSDYPPDIDLNADIFELDLFETKPEAIRYLHERGKKVICYFNAGAWEEYRPDADQFAQEVIGKPYIGWPGEKWLDVGSFATFADLMTARLDLAVDKGCDGIDPDNVNGYQQPTGFDITAQDQLAYNIWLSEQAHQRGLAIGLKNCGEQVGALIDHFDFAVIEDCDFYGECSQYLPFIEVGKAVYQIEYTDRAGSLARICESSRSFGFQILLKNRGLDASVTYCP